MSRTITVQEVICRKPAAGIDNYSRVLFGAIGAVAGGVAAAGATTATGGILVATVGLGFVGGAGMGVGVIEGLDYIFSGSDDLYIKVNGSKIWPKDDYIEMKSQQTRLVDYTVPFNGNVTIEFMEWDRGSNDDSLGILTVYPDRIDKDGYYTFLVYGSDEEGSVYEIVLKIATKTEVSWDTPGPINYGTALGTTQLSAQASVPGTFNYTPAAGAILPVGNHTLSITFTPIDPSNYASISKSVQITVKKATPTITWPTPEAIVQGTPIGKTQLNASATAEVDGRRIDVEGDYSYFLNDKPVKTGDQIPAGQYTLRVRFEPNGSGNFTGATGSVQLRVWLATHVFSKYEAGNEETFSHLALKHYGHATPYYWQWIIDHNKGIIPENYKLTRAGTKVYIPESPPPPK